MERQTRVDLAGCPACHEKRHDDNRNKDRYDETVVAEREIERNGEKNQRQFDQHGNHDDA